MFAIIELARKLVQFLEWAVEYLKQVQKERKLETIKEAHEAAADAKTIEEKARAAKAIEEAVGLVPSGSSPKPRRKLVRRNTTRH